MMNAAALLQSTLPDLKLVKRGKVRDVYAVDDERLLIVATDRISAFAETGERYPRRRALLIKEWREIEGLAEPR